jgi:serine/threonine protein kinase
MQPLAPGVVLLDGRFAIVRLIAHGGQAETYEAIDKREGQRVAIKRFVVRGASSWKDVELAEREARVLSALSHPGIPRHIAHFEENGELYLVTEYIDGETLDALSKGSASGNQGTAPSTSAQRRLSQADVVKYLFAIAELLDYLHSQSPPIIHRDIKPKNVIRRQDGSFVLVDFGSVRDRLKPEGGSTVVGTFGYMAPEQFQGRALPASDTYAAAATALALLTGRDPDQLPHQGLKLDVEKALGSTASNELKRVLKSALEPDPDQRAQALSQLLRSSSLRRGDARSSTGSNWTGPTAQRAASNPPSSEAPPLTDVPFRTHGYQRQRSAREKRLADERGAARADKYRAQVEQQVHDYVAHQQDRLRDHLSREQRRNQKRAARQQRRAVRRDHRDNTEAQDWVIDIETPLRHALRDRDLRRFINIPIVAVVLTLLFVIARTALWFALGVALPILLLVVHRVFGAPVLEEARRSRQIARQIRSQMRRVSHGLSARNLGEEGAEEQPPPPARFRVESTVPNSEATASKSPTDFAREFDEEAFELETQLDEAVEKLRSKS